jgi:hypothetical protein
MNTFDVLTNKNFILYCAKCYDNPQCAGVEEFYEDLQRIKYIKKLLTRYTQSGDLKERLILNHIIVLNNVFGPEPTCKILFLKMKKFLPYLKPFLVMLNILPDVIRNVEKAEATIYTDTIAMDNAIVEALRKI